MLPSSQRHIGVESLRDSTRKQASATRMIGDWCTYRVRSVKLSDSSDDAPLDRRTSTGTELRREGELHVRVRGLPHILSEERMWQGYPLLVWQRADRWQRTLKERDSLHNELTMGCSYMRSKII